LYILFAAITNAWGHVIGIFPPEVSEFTEVGSLPEFDRMRINATHSITIK
jgi:hypothetical protein